MAQTFDFRQTYFGQPRWLGSEGQFAYLYGIVVLNSQSYRDNTCPSLLISYTSGLSTPHIARLVSSRLHSLSRYTQHSSRYHDVSSLFSENFLLRVLLARSRGYSRPWFRRSHSKQHKRFEMFTPLRVVLFHVSKLKNVLHFRNLV